MECINLSKFVVIKIQRIDLKKMKNKFLSYIFLASLAVAFLHVAKASVDYHGQTINGYNFTTSSYDADDFSNSDFSGVTAIDTSFSTATVNRIFTDSNFSNSNLKDALFNYAGLSGVDFSSANLYGAYFISANLANADFTNAIISYADFTSTVQYGFSAEQLYSTASYQSKTLQYVSFEYNDLEGWNFSGQNLTRANFSISSLINADFRNANLTNAIFGAPNLSGTDFRGSTGATWSSAITTNTILADGNLNGGALNLSGQGNSLIIRVSDTSAVLMTASGAVSDGAELIFEGKYSSTDNSLLKVSGDGVSLDLSGAKIDVYLAEGFGADSEVFLNLIEASDGAGIVLNGLSKEDVAVFNSDGTVYAGEWALSASTSEVGIIVGIPEPADAVCIFSMAALFYCIFRRLPNLRVSQK